MGQLIVRLWPLGFAKTELYPISSLKLADKNAIWKLFQEEEVLLRKDKPEMRNHRFSSKLEKEGPLLFEASFIDSYSKKSGVMIFEIYEEAKLREKSGFLV